MQPLFPGESGVGQLAEIIKVRVIYLTSTSESLIDALSYCIYPYFSGSVLETRNTNQRGN